MSGLSAGGWLRSLLADPLAVAILLAVVAFLLRLLAEVIGAARDRRWQRHALIAAFAGEILAIRGALKRHLITALGALERGSFLIDYSPHLPNNVFSGNSHRLGELHNSLLIGQLSQVYELLGQLGPMGRLIEQHGEADRRLHFGGYVARVGVCFHLAVLLDMHLRALTPKGFREEQWSITAKKEDVDDRELGQRAISLGAQQAGLPRPEGEDGPS